MGRVRAGARPAAPCPQVDGRPVALLVRRLLIALASLALLGGGAAELLPRPGSATGPGTSAAVAAGPAAGAQMQAPARAALLRGVALAIVPAPPGPAAGLPPARASLAGATLVAGAVTGRPDSPLAGVAQGAADGRAPPAAAGT